MRRKLPAFLLFLLLLAAASDGALVISSPYHDGIKENRVEIGSTQNVTLQYQNGAIYPVDLSRLDISLVYDGDLIDQIEGITDISGVFDFGEVDHYTAGSIKLGLFPAEKTVRVGPGEVIDLARITFHLNQSPKRVNYSTKLFSMDTEPAAMDTGVSARFLTADILTIPDTFIEESQAPAFKGISKITTVNQPGGFFQSIEWNPASDRTPPIYYGVHRRGKDEDWSSLAGDVSDNFAQDTYADQGTYYEYAVTARDSAAPVPNETKLVPVSNIAIDVTSPGEVTELKVDHKGGENRLTWKNPIDADLAGVAVLVNYNEPVGAGRLAGAEAKSPYNDGREYYDWEEPFGAGKGYVRHISYMAFDPKDVPEEYIDDYTAPEITFNYRVITYDLASGSPRKMGRNYSSGMDASVTTPADAGPSGSAPQINLWVNNRLAAASQVYNVSETPSIKAEVIVKDPQDYEYALLVDGKSEEFSRVSIEKDKAVLEADPQSPLTSGRHVFTVQTKRKERIAAFAEAPAAVSLTVLVAGGPLRIMDYPLAFPSPWDPEKDGPVTFQYTLSRDARTGVDIYVFSPTAEIVKKKTFMAGEEGGAGQTNKVTWNGMTDQGNPVANGIYWVNIIDRDSGTALGKLKLTVHRRR